MPFYHNLSLHCEISSSLYYSLLGPWWNGNNILKDVLELLVKDMVCLYAYMLFKEVHD